MCDLKPSGRFVATDFHRAGGVPQVLKMLLEQGLLNGNCLTITGRTLAHYQSGNQTRRVQELMDIAPTPLAEMHPRLARRHRLSDGDMVTLCRQAIKENVVPGACSDIHIDVLISRPR